MTETSERVHPLQRELYDLVELAETSTRAVDDLRSKLEEATVRYFLFGFLSAISMSGAFFSYTVSGRESAQGYLALAFSIGALVVGGLGFFKMFSTLTHLKRLRRHLNVEKSILMDLGSLIDDQRHRLDGASALSLMAKATLDMRLRRLDRTDLFRK